MNNRCRDPNQIMRVIYILEATLKGGICALIHLIVRYRFFSAQ